jgi:hypothetical protein
LLALAFFVFLFYGNVAVGVAFLVLGVVFVVNGSTRGSRTEKAVSNGVSTPSNCRRSTGSRGNDSLISAELGDW